MSVLSFLGGLGSAYQHVQGGIDAERKRQLQEEDVAHNRKLREFRLGQQERTLREQQRADKLRDDLAAVPTTEEVDINKGFRSNMPMVDDDDYGSPSAAQLPAMKTVPRAKDAQLRDMSGVLRKSGDVAGAMKLEEAAEKELFGRSAKQFSQLEAGAASMTPEQLAKSAAQIFDNDPFPQQVGAIRQLPSGGVSIDIVHRDTGQKITKDFKDNAALIEGLRAYYSPQSYEALMSARREAAIKTQQKVDEVNADPSKRFLPRGNNFFDTTTGKWIEGPTQPGAGGAGTGAGKGKEPKSVLEVARSMMADAFEKGEIKAASPAQRAEAENYLGRIVQGNPGIPPERAQKIAVLAATDPARRAPAINAETGSIDLMFQDDDGKSYSLVPNFATTQDYEKRGIKPADMLNSVKSMLSQQGDASKQAEFVAAAHDPAAKQRLEAAAKASAQSTLEQYIKRNAELGSPVPEQLIRQRAAEAFELYARNTDRKLALVKQFIKPPAPPSEKPGPGSGGPSWGPSQGGFGFGDAELANPFNVGP